MNRLFACNMIALSVTGLIATNVVHAKGAARAVPVMVGAQSELDACTSIGRSSNPRKPLIVRVAPSASAAVSASLRPKHLVWICQFGVKSQYYGIVFSDWASSHKKDGLPPACGVNSPIDKPKAYKGPCLSGWVKEKDLTAIAG